MTASDSLIERLSVAEVGSRELDAHVEVAVRRVEASRVLPNPATWAKWEPCRDGYVQDPHTRYASNPVTTSLDAALALAERVLPGWAWEIRTDLAGASVQAAPSWWLEGLAAPDEGGVSVDGKTSALAVCLGVLKAKEASQ
jgi:hypothetical protein